MFQTIVQLFLLLKKPMDGTAKPDFFYSWPDRSVGLKIMT